jgi:GTPase SAR1 family protein
MQITKIIVNHPTYALAMSAIRDTHYSGKDGEFPKNLSIVGISGVGKSTLLKQYVQSHPAIHEPERTRVPVAYVEVPPRPTFKQFAVALLNSIHAPLYGRGTATSQFSRFLQLAVGCGVEIILVDEIQHFVDRGSVKTYGAVADQLKVLSDTLKIPIILAGAPRMRTLFETNMQLRRRFKSSIHLRPFDINSESENLLGFLTAVAEEINIPHKAKLCDPVLAERIWYATDGVPANVIDLIRSLQELLQRKSSGNWNYADFAQAFRNAIWGDAPDSLNPFIHSGQVLRRLDKPGEPYVKSVLDGDNHHLAATYTTHATEPESDDGPPLKEAA